VIDRLIVPLQEVKDGGEASVDASVPAADFPDAVQEGELAGPVRVKGTVRQQDDRAHFLGTAQGSWTIECLRCLKPTPGSFTAELECEGPVDAASLDLTEEVRQAIVLAQPMKTLCRPDCRGLCPVCRADRNEKDCGHKEETPASPTRTRLTRKPHKG
jgi:uncharacterized protein